MLVDFLWREGETLTARNLGHEALFVEYTEPRLLKKIWDDVRKVKNEDHDSLLLWCAQSKAGLSGQCARLEFDLHVREFIKRARTQNSSNAVLYARNHLQRWHKSKSRSLSQTLMCLAFPEYQWPGTENLSRETYQLLVALLQTKVQFSCLPKCSNFVAHLQAGLSMLKLNRLNVQDLGAIFQRISPSLPLFKFSRSKLVCDITKQIMNDTDPPLVMPTGFTCSTSAINFLVADIKTCILCPWTGQGPYVCSELRKAYLA